MGSANFKLPPDQASPTSAHTSVDFSNLQNGSAGKAMPVAPALVEVRLQNGRSVHFDSTMDAAILARLIQVVETA